MNLAGHMYDFYSVFNGVYFFSCFSCLALYSNFWPPMLASYIKPPFVLLYFGTMATHYFHLHLCYTLKKDFTSQVHKFMASLNDTIYQQQGKTVLYIPLEDLDGNLSELSKDKDLTQRLETTMIHNITRGPRY